MGYELEIALVGGFGTVIAAIVRFLKPMNGNRYVRKDVCNVMHESLHQQMGDIKENVGSIDEKLSRIMLKMRVD
jgi:hypothetical protein